MRHRSKSFCERATNTKANSDSMQNNDQPLRWFWQRRSSRSTRSSVAILSRVYVVFHSIRLHWQRDKLQKSWRRDSLQFSCRKSDASERICKHWHSKRHLQVGVDYQQGCVPYRPCSSCTTWFCSITVLHGYSRTSKWLPGNMLSRRLDKWSWSSDLRTS